VHTKAELCTGWNQKINRHARLKAFFQDYLGEPVLERETNLDFTEARDSEWHWHQLVHMQVTSLQTDNHASTPSLNFLQVGCPSCRLTNSIKALKAKSTEKVLSKYLCIRLLPLMCRVLRRTAAVVLCRCRSMS